MFDFANCYIGGEEMKELTEVVVREQIRGGRCSCKCIAGGQDKPKANGGQWRVVSIGFASSSSDCGSKCNAHGLIYQDCY